ncbi:hypothetical protein [Brachyspira pilosicoli]|uniref:Uncharacterized protein n=1 Tax=Brachyspira pilosicoli (strain ATCC BAA-1826 / 95/1000) TaxID=759914 RepID=D8IFC8_BRAP9|nr:hypothetical protein [Brachyspira pilosicoli]ADK31851.1 hypothetical protein BP951000_1872 [Brachyspira pilosicoli 95/1000]
MNNDNIQKYEEEIIRYVSGLDVSKEFLSLLENDINIQNRVNSLRLDLFVMENIEDSNMFEKSINKASIKIKNGIIESFNYFSILTPLLSRGENVTEKTFIYKNIEISKYENEYYLNIRDIKKYCIIHKNKEEIINIWGDKESYELKLDNGNYNIKTDYYECDINIE